MKKKKLPESPESIALRKAKALSRTQRFRKANPLKVRAHWALGNAIRRGHLSKKPCEVCGEVKVEAHHEDYSKPLEVRWFCKKHHLAQHDGGRYGKI